MVGSIVMSSCGPPTSKYPLSNRADSIVDTEIIGSWQDICDTKITVVFTVTDSPVIDLQVIENKNEPDTSYYKVFLTKIGDRGFLSIAEVRPDEITGWSRKDDMGYYIGKYEFSRNNRSLKIFLMNEDEVDRAIRKGKLNGESKVSSSPNGQSKEVSIDDSPETLRNFVASANHKKLFKVFSEYKRIGK